MSSSPARAGYAVGQPFRAECRDQHVVRRGDARAPASRSRRAGRRCRSARSAAMRLSTSSRTRGKCATWPTASASSAVAMGGDPVGRIEEDRLRADIGLGAALRGAASSRTSKQRAKCGSRRRPAIDDDQLAEPLRRLERQRQPDDPARGMADEMRAIDAERVHQADQIVGHRLRRTGRSGSARSLRPVPR